MKIKVTIEYEVEPEMHTVTTGSKWSDISATVLHKECERFRDLLEPLNLENGLFKIEETK